MKKSIFLLVALMFAVLPSYSQDTCKQEIENLKRKINQLENELRSLGSTKRIQAGLTTNMGMNFLIPGKTKLINSKQIKSLGKKEFNPKKKQAMSKDDIEAYYKSIGMDTPDDEKVDLTGVDNIFGDEEDEEEL